MEYWRNDGCDYRKPNNNNNLHSYSNWCERLYQICYCYCDGKSVAKCYGYCFSCYHLCRPKQHDYCYRRRHISVEYRRNNGCYYRKPCCNYYLYCYSNRRQRLYQNGYGYRYGEPASNCNGYTKSGHNL